MPTRKKVLVRNTVRRGSSPMRKKVLENVQVQDLITSSATKKNLRKSFPKMRGIPSSKDLDSDFYSFQNEMKDIFRGDNAADGININFKESNGSITHHVIDTMFSPAFHICNYVAEGPATGVENGRIYENNGTSRSQVDLLNNGSSHKEPKCSCQKTGTVSELVLNGMDLESSTSLQQYELSDSYCQMPPPEINAVSSCCHDDLLRSSLPSAASVMLFSMQQSESENGNAASENIMSTEVSVDADYSEDIHDFGSYLFIKGLPDLSSVVPAFRPMLLPKQTRSCPPTTLVLDLDETLVHSKLEPTSDADFTLPVNFDLKEYTVYVRCRPHLQEFLERIANIFEVIIFTASQKIYAKQLLDKLDPRGRLFRHRVYRESCIFVEGNYLKDLSVLGRDLARVIIVDNSPEAFGFQVNNGIQIESWFDDPSDQELLLLLPFLESLATVEDVRPLIANKYDLQEKIAAAVILHSTLSKKTPL